jgi:hypothetical protein
MKNKRAILLSFCPSAALRKGLHTEVNALSALGGRTKILRDLRGLFCIEP